MCDRRGEAKVIEDQYILTEIGECELRGKNKKVKLLTAKKNTERIEIYHTMHF